MADETVRFRGHQVVRIQTFEITVVRHRRAPLRFELFDACVTGAVGGYSVPNDKEGCMLFLLWLLAVILVVTGIVYLVRGAVAMGLVLIIIGFLVGPGGVSIFN
jgi:hypothetical protein